VEIYPAIDLRGGKCVRLIQGDYARQIDYAEDPIAVAQTFQKAGARWLHVVDLDGARTGEPANFDVLAAICRAGDLKVQFGGGLRDESQIARAMELGAARVVVGTRALQDWAWFEQILGRSDFHERVALALDAREGTVAVKGWLEDTQLQATDVVGRLADLPVATVIYTDISRDGMLTGPNLQAITQVARRSPVPVIASGGVGSLDDIGQLLQIGVAGVIVGRALYEGRIDLAEAIRLARGD